MSNSKTFIPDSTGHKPATYENLYDFWVSLGLRKPEDKEKFLQEIKKEEGLDTSKMHREMQSCYPDGPEGWGEHRKTSWPNRTRRRR